jgi:hypothetical protein
LQLRDLQGLTRIKIWQRTALGVFVPRTSPLAIVAAINSIANEGAQFMRYFTGVFYREVRNTTPGI